MLNFYKLELFIKEVFFLLKIGLLQLTQNLDDAINGFKAGLIDLGIVAEFYYCNADGNQAMLPKLAGELAAANVDLIFACSTPAAKAAQALPENIPVLFTPVFDPVQTKLVSSLNAPSGKLTGMSGMVQADEKVKFIIELLPDAKNIGIIYHTKDENSLIEHKNFVQAATGYFNVVDIAINSPEEISMLEDKLVDIDAVFLPIGRIVEENFSSIAYYTDAHNIPIVASHAPNVAMGALGALVANHYSLGQACAKQAKQILIDKINVGQVPVGITDKPEILLNAFTADNLGIKIATQLSAKAKEVYN